MTKTKEHCDEHTPPVSSFPGHDQWGGLPSSPQQRAFICGAYTGTAQVGVSLVSLLDPLFKRSRLHCQVVQMYVSHHICDTYNYDDDTYTNSVDTMLVRYHTRPAVCHSTDCACFAKNMMTLCQQYP